MAPGAVILRDIFFVGIEHHVQNSHKSVHGWCIPDLENVI